MAVIIACLRPADRPRAKHKIKDLRGGTPERPARRRFCQPD
ncbi:hypothetical protein J2S43_002313 [Catenuloplanes nepalensis]|uniref:Uncharacterized protein n=1 Tax=Catenuloplanes nepalensis TaxID=587533 RepID=A0ABT9MR72_9ACTN|nr:hypothetical protein [Catenuloplanes nepalensis]